jgi:hypothetical protein
LHVGRKFYLSDCLEPAGDEKETACPVHFCAAQQLLTMGAAPQLTSMIESAFIATAFRLSVSRARSALPVTRPPIGDPEQSAALNDPNTMYG